jgi:hypothetical protein
MAGRFLVVLLLVEKVSLTFVDFWDSITGVGVDLNLRRSPGGIVDETV